MHRKILLGVVCGTLAFGAFFNTANAQSVAGNKVIKTEKYDWKSGHKGAVGDMELKYLDGGMVLAHISTVVDGHDCDVDDVQGKLKNGIIAFAQKSEDTGEMCRIKVKLISNKASVVSKNCHSSYCGMRGYFDGKYIKK